MATINGSSGNDTLAGTSGNDTISGFGGNDLILAGSTGGADVIDGGTGSDSIEFKERATSAVVVDFVAGTISGGSSGTISFTNIERVVGGNFNDRLSGNGAGQTLTGQAGADTLWGAGGIDTLWGGAGADRFIFRETGTGNADLVRDWASGSDKLLLDGAVMSALGATGNFAAGDARFKANSTGTATDASDRVIYNTSNGQVWYDADGNGAGARQLIATLQSGATLVATDIAVEGGSSGGGQTINGTSGNDSLVGGPGNDTINGFDGDDTIDGAAGADSMVGGAHADTYFVDNPGDVIVEFENGGFDTVNASVSYTLPQWVNHLTLVGPDPDISGTGNELPNVIEGNAGQNSIFGFAGDDHLDGGDGHDHLEGGEGSDTMLGGAGRDGFRVAAEGGRDSIDGGGDVDSVGMDVNLTQVIVDLQAGTISAAGVVIADVLAVEWVFATNFADQLTGDGFANNFLGLAGPDTLDGRGGNDTLNGEGGEDLYRFSVAPSATNADLVFGFASGFDTIQLDGTVHANSGPSGTFAAGDARFWSSSSGTAHDADDRVIYNTSSGWLVYDADGTGSGAAQLITTLWTGIVGTPSSIAATDITIINGSGGGGQTINGTSGNDSLVGGPGNDTINGFDGDDTINGLSGSDSLVGGEGRDVLTGGDGDDTLDGWFSENFFDEEQVPDTLNGGLGNDVFWVDNAGDALTDSGGTDTVRVKDLHWTLAAGYENLVIHNDTAEHGFTGIGNELDNHIAATYSGSRLEGRGGDDTLIGGNNSGNSFAHVLGGEGNDSIRGTGDFGDTLDGGAGNDTISAAGDESLLVYSVAPGAANADIIVDFGSDTFQLDGTVHVNSGPSGRFAAGDARFWSSGTGAAHDADDRVIYNTANGQLWYDADGNGAGAAQLIATLQGAPTLAATDIEVINGSGSGGQVINGTSGNDTLTGTSGNDTISGFGGNDLFLAGSTGGADVINGGTGSDSIEFKAAASSGIVVNFNAATITGGSAGGSITFTGIERVVGGNFNDSLSGTVGSQTLTGQAGADTLTGGAGNDTLWGGGGAGDTFIFREMGSANADRVSDFTSAVDKIGLDDSAFTVIGASGNFAAGDARFAAGAGFTSGRDASDRVVYNTSTGSLYYDADGSGAGAAQLIATLLGNPAIAATDIAVI